MIRVNNQYDLEWRPGMTVQDVLDALKFTFRMIAVKVNGQPVLRRDFATHRGAGWGRGVGAAHDQRGIEKRRTGIAAMPVRLC